MMAKFLKSLFNSGERKKSSVGLEDEDRNDFAPPLDSRRKLSISRSGRMKQNKKRASISQDLFGEGYYTNEKRMSKEYHVHGRAFSENLQQAASSSQPAKENTARVKKKAGDFGEEDTAQNILSSKDDINVEEEIEVAFKIIETNF